MKTNIKLVLVSSMMVLISACAGQAKNTLLLDLDRVASETNRDTLITQQVKQAEGQLNQQLAEIKKDLQQQLKTEIGKIKAKKKAEKMQQTQRLEKEAEQEMQRSILSAKRQAQTYQVGLIEEFKAEVLPIAEQIAKQRKATIIRMKDANVLWSEPSIDITDVVIAKLKANSTKQRAQPVEKTDKKQL